jgi:hypothetical protein
MVASVAHTLTALAPSILCFALLCPAPPFPRRAPFGLPSCTPRLKPQAPAWPGRFSCTHVSAPHTSETASTNAARARLISPAAPCRNTCQARPQLKRPQVPVGSAFPRPSHRSRRCLLHAMACERVQCTSHSSALVQTLRSACLV